LRTGYNVRVWSITRNVTSAPDFAEATASTTDAADTPPIIQINGDNPAIIQVGDTYNDLGATITGPQADLNLGITTYLKGTLTSNIVIDTTQPATDTIDYVATDQSDLTATSTRTVIIQPAATSPSPQSGQGSVTDTVTSTAPASTASTTATTTSP